MLVLEMMFGRVIDDPGSTPDQSCAWWLDLHLNELIRNLLELWTKQMLVCMRLVHWMEVYCPHWRCGPQGR
jgi:hypothetical protein